VILIGGVSFHYFAGFTGGRKLICPGLASTKTISQTHKLAFDCETIGRRSGVGTALLDGNAVHEAFAEIAEKIAPAFCISTIVNDDGEAIDLFCGDMSISHRAACDAYAESNTIYIAEKRELVVVSGGGSPHDLNMIQAHKALEAASKACTEGGTIILLAECIEGLGKNDFLNWFDCVDSKALAEKLCANYQVNGQTAWSLLQKAEGFNVHIITSLDESTVEQMIMRKASSLDEALKNVGSDVKGYIVPFGAKVFLNHE
jgi:nickel-dependent lactate racemase